MKADRCAGGAAGITTGIPICRQRRNQASSACRSRVDSGLLSLLNRNHQMGQAVTNDHSSTQLSPINNQQDQHLSEQDPNRAYHSFGETPHDLWERLPRELLPAIVEASPRPELCYIQLLGLSHAIRSSIRVTLHNLCFKSDHLMPDLTADSMAALVGPCRNLWTLSFPISNGCNDIANAARAAWVDETFGGHTQLAVLKNLPLLPESDVERILSHLPGLVELTVSPDLYVSTRLLAALARSCPGLQVLRCSLSPKFQPDFAAALAPLSGVLNELDLWADSSLDESLAALVGSLSAVTSLKLPRCPPAALAPIASHLTSLKLSSDLGKESDLSGLWLCRLETLALHLADFALSQLNLPPNQTTLRRFTLTLDCLNVEDAPSLMAVLRAMPHLTHLDLFVGWTNCARSALLPPDLVGRLECLAFGLQGGRESDPVCIASSRLRELTVFLPMGDQLASLQCPQLRILKAPIQSLAEVAPMPNLEVAVFRGLHPTADPAWLLAESSPSPRLRVLCGVRLTRPDLLARLLCACASSLVHLQAFLSMDATELPNPLVLRLPGQLEHLDLHIESGHRRSPDLQVEAPGLLSLSLTLADHADLPSARVRLQHCPHLARFRLRSRTAFSLQTDDVMMQPRRLYLLDGGIESASLFDLLTRHGARLRTLTINVEAMDDDSWMPLMVALYGLPRLTGLILLGFPETAPFVLLASPQLRSLDLRTLLPPAGSRRRWPSPSMRLSPTPVSGSPRPRRRGDGDAATKPHHWDDRCGQSAGFADPTCGPSRRGNSEWRGVKTGIWWGPWLPRLPYLHLCVVACLPPAANALVDELPRGLDKGDQGIGGDGGCGCFSQGRDTPGTASRSLQAAVRLIWTMAKQNSWLTEALKAHPESQELVTFLLKVEAGNAERRRTGKPQKPVEIPRKISRQVADLLDDGEGAVLRDSYLQAWNALSLMISTRCCCVWRRTIPGPRLQNVLHLMDVPPKFAFVIAGFIDAHFPVPAPAVPAPAVPAPAVPDPVARNVEVAYLRSSFCKGAVESSFVVATGMTIGELRAQHENQMIFVPNENPTADSLGIAPADIELVRPSTHYVLAEPFTLYTFMVDAQPYIPRQRRGGSLRCTLRLLATEQNFRGSIFHPPDHYLVRVAIPDARREEQLAAFRQIFSAAAGFALPPSPIFSEPFPRCGPLPPSIFSYLPPARGEPRFSLGRQSADDEARSVTLHPATPIVFEDFGTLTQQGVRLSCVQLVSPIAASVWSQVVIALGGLPRLTHLTLNVRDAPSPLSLAYPHGRYHMSPSPKIQHVAFSCSERGKNKKERNLSDQINTGWVWEGRHQ
ncbi:hypothetical protein PAPYR_532 [Paratrimastix pyriformis]|uniref:F-box domain-containing protein n=1 Tax=Paratrimastix pyriformis TaxID=342808 RepID=A0ABQ8UVV6_9EUKA|nr:hypothetical protein PAPYR_532 [Paratrimastix pyriformis]